MTAITASFGFTTIPAARAKAAAPSASRLRPRALPASPWAQAPGEGVVVTVASGVLLALACVASLGAIAQAFVG